MNGFLDSEGGDALAGFRGVRPQGQTAADAAVGQACLKGGRRASAHPLVSHPAAALPYRNGPRRHPPKVKNDVCFLNLEGNYVRERGILHVLQCLKTFSDTCCLFVQCFFLKTDESLGNLHSWFSRRADSKNNQDQNIEYRVFFSIFPPCPGGTVSRKLNYVPKAFSFIYDLISQKKR